MNELEQSLFAAVQENRLADVQHLLDSSSVNVNCRNLYDETPVVVAIRKGHLGVARLFLARQDLDLHAHGNLSGTPLTCAIYYKREIAEELLAKEDKFKDINHPCAFLAAVFHNNADILEKLIAKEADINSTGGKVTYKKHAKFDLSSCGFASPFFSAGWPIFDLPVIVALKGGHSEALSVLLAKGVNLDIPGAEGKTARELITSGNISHQCNDVVKAYLSQLALSGAGASKTNDHTGDEAHHKDISKSEELGALSVQVSAPPKAQGDKPSNPLATAGPAMFATYKVSKSTNTERDDERLKVEKILNCLRQDPSIWNVVSTEPAILGKVIMSINDLPTSSHPG